MPASRDDLFELFPDLPWSTRPSRESRQRAIGASVDQWRERALKNISRQKRAAAAVRKRIAGLARRRSR
jgi:hypothetical protein